MWKGRVDAAPCQFTCNAGKQHTIGLFTTHMPVGYGSYTKSVGCSFGYLATTIKSWLQGNKGSTAVLLGDLNIDYYNQAQVGSGTEYQDTVLGPLKNAGLIDAAAAASNAPLCTIIPGTNTLWQYFNGDPTGQSNQLIDYFMYANSVDSSMTVEVTSIAPIYPTPTNDQALTIVVNEEINGVGPPINLTCSDHYPVDIIATINGPD